jgi:carbonic anhydrase
VVIHHTKCGLLTFTDEQFAADLEASTGERPAWAARTFSDLEEDVRDSVRRIRGSPFIPRRDRVSGFVYECETGLVRPVS